MTAPTSNNTALWFGVVAGVGVAAAAAAAAAAGLVCLHDGEADAARAGNDRAKWTVRPAPRSSRRLSASSSSSSSSALLLPASMAGASTGTTPQRPTAVPLPEPVPTPQGPAISASLPHGFCGHRKIHISRLPYGAEPARPVPSSPCAPEPKPGWADLFSVLHPEELPHHSPSPSPSSSSSKSALKWTHLPLTPAVYPPPTSPSPRSTAHLPVSRATLLVLLLLSNSRIIYRHSGAAGLRAAYASYTGLITISWPIGGAAVAEFAPHDLPRPYADVYPPSIPVDVAAVINMAAGVVVDHHHHNSSDGELRLAYPGRPERGGQYRLEFVPKGYAGQHGSRHLYNLLHGTVYSVDAFVLTPSPPTHAYANPLRVLHYRHPSAAGDDDEHITIPLLRHREMELLARSLAALPWSRLSWSMHRGLRDLLLAFGKERMDASRTALAATLRATVASSAGAKTLVERAGWERTFVQRFMPDVVDASVRAARGNSGDAVRCVVAAAETAWALHRPVAPRDKTLAVEDASMLAGPAFWEGPHAPPASADDGGAEGWLPPESVLALVKYWVLEWSQEFDYQAYHDLPVTVLLA